MPKPCEKYSPPIINSSLNSPDPCLMKRPPGKYIFNTFKKLKDELSPHDNLLIFFRTVSIGFRDCSINGCLGKNFPDHQKYYRYRAKGYENKSKVSSRGSIFANLTSNKKPTLYCPFQGGGEGGVGLAILFRVTIFFTHFTTTGRL